MSFKTKCPLMTKRLPYNFISCKDIFRNSKFGHTMLLMKLQKAISVIYQKGEVKQNTDFVYLSSSWMNWKIQ